MVTSESGIEGVRQLVLEKQIGSIYVCTVGGRGRIAVSKNVFNGVDEPSMSLLKALDEIKNGIVENRVKYGANDNLICVCDVDGDYAVVADQVGDVVGCCSVSEWYAMDAKRISFYPTGSTEYLRNIDSYKLVLKSVREYSDAVYTGKDIILGKSLAVVRDKTSFSMYTTDSFGAIGRYVVKGAMCPDTQYAIAHYIAENGVEVKLGDNRTGIVECSVGTLAVKWQNGIPVSIHERESGEPVDELKLTTTLPFSDVSVARVSVFSRHGEYATLMCLGRKICVTKSEYLKKGAPLSAIKCTRRYPEYDVCEADLTESLEDIQDLVLCGLEVRVDGYHDIVPVKVGANDIVKYAIYLNNTKVGKGKCSVKAYKSGYVEKTLSGGGSKNVKG